jgi:hypothetical protein
VKVVLTHHFEHEDVQRLRGLEALRDRRIAGAAIDV